MYSPLIPMMSGLDFLRTVAGRYKRLDTTAAAMVPGKRKETQNGKTFIHI